MASVEVSPELAGFANNLLAPVIRAGLAVIDEEVKNCKVSHALAERQDRVKAASAYPDSPWLWYMEPRFLDLWKALADLGK